MPEINRQIFMGDGDKSMVQCYYLHQRLEEAFHILNKIQQQPRPIDPPKSFEEHDREYEEAKKDTEDIAKEIYVALTGKKPWK